jgi:two-component system CheB/CheR fusion protein
MATRKNQIKTAASPETPDTRTAAFPIVGIGASAGGLEAFEQFFRHLPPECGMAFVLVPHLDPSHASLLSEILQRTTAMPVVEATDQMVLTPDRVHVIPPNRDMAIFHGTLQLSVPELPRGQRMPIDAFLRSLAEDQGERAIGIILSGTGTDGTLGLRAILGAGGITLAQEPATAKYDGMPVSAIQAGYATHVLPVEKMPAILLADMHAMVVQHEAPPAPTAASGMKRILMLLRSTTGHDFSQYKKSTIGRRIERRMSQHNIGDIEIYARYLKEHPAEVQILFRELLINVTSFFRDPEAFVSLKEDILPHLLAGKPEDYIFRAWVAGCATGEEAYSIAMLLREYMDETRQEFKIQLYSTDLDDDAIAVARAGIYPPNIAQDIHPERLRRFFSKEDAGYRVKKDIREYGGVCHPECHQRPAVYPARPAQLPQPDDLSGAGTAKPPHPCLPLRAQAGWGAVPLAIGKHRQPPRTVCAAQPQMEALPRYWLGCLRPCSDVRRTIVDSQQQYQGAK